MQNISIGCDIEEISRFENKTLENDKGFLNRIFTKNELEYCYSKKNFASHLCARYCAKEAIIKALSGFNISNIYYSDIEILNKDNGAPFAKIIKYPEIKIKISISHSRSNAVAYVIIYKEL